MFVALIVGALLLAILFFKIHKNYVILAFSKRIKTVDGSDINALAPVAQSSSIFGNNFDLVGSNSEEWFTYMRKNAQLKKNYIQYFAGTPTYNVVTAEEAELIVTDSRLITKGQIYKFLWPFIKIGLLTSTDAKWRTRRKMLSPAFHFNILELFMEIFKEESTKFVNSLKKTDGETISLSQLIPRITLNVVCETALGVKLDNMKEGDTYRNHIEKVENAWVKRISNPLYMNDFVWKHFGNSAEYDPSYKIIHQFSSNIIQKRRAMFDTLQSAKKDTPSTNDEDDSIFLSSKKQRYAMLDTLLMAEKEGLIDHEGICEEVDTIIFEGFDTTSMGLVYAIMNLSVHPEMQQKCFEEIKYFIDDDLTKLTILEVNKLEYLDRFLKESLRTYPSVPLILRQTVEETKLSNNILLPKGTAIAIHLYDILRDPKQFKNPDVFDPDRFLPENSIGRNPYAFLPFSAGSRNCIGQKSAMMEMKTVLLHLVKNFELFQVGDPKDLTYNQGFLLRMTQDIKVRIVKRK